MRRTAVTSPITMLAFDDVGSEVFAVARITLVILVLALLARATQALAAAISRENDIVYEAMLGLDREAGQRFYKLYRSRGPKSVAFAWLCSVVAGPIGAFGYLRDWRMFGIALVTVNGLGAWWVESWFSVPQLVLARNRRIARWAVDQVSKALKRDARAE